MSTSEKERERKNSGETAITSISESVSDPVLVVGADQETTLQAHEAKEANADQHERTADHETRIESLPSAETASQTAARIDERIDDQIVEKEQASIEPILEFNSVGYLQDALTTQLSARKKGLYVGLLLGLVSFKFIFGVIALATLLMWLILIFVLTKLHRLNTNYDAKVDVNGVHLRRIHWLGHESLSLPWQKIEEAEFEEKDEFNRFLKLRPEKGAVSFLNRILFQDLYDTEKRICIPPSYRLKTSEEVKKSENERSIAFFESAKQHCPEEKTKFRLEAQGCLEPVLKFNSVSYLQEALVTQLSKKKKNIYVGLLLGLVSFKFIFGGVALATILMWLMLICILTKVNRLNANYDAKVDADGVNLRRIHWLGHENLSLPWQKIEEARFEEKDDYNRFLKLRPAKGAVSLINRILFQDLYDSEKSICIPPSYRLRTSEETRKSENELSIGFFELAKHHCPQEKAKSFSEANDSISKKEKPEFHGEKNYELIKYASNSKFQRALLSFLKRSEKALLLPLFFATALLLVNAGVSQLLFMLSLFVLIPLVLLSFTKERSVSIFCVFDGISIIWDTFGDSQRSKTIPWNAIDYVRVSTQYDLKRRQSQKIDFRINPANPQTAHINMLMQLSPYLFKSHKDEKYLSIDLECLNAGAEAKKDLLAAINRFLPAEKVDESIHELLNPTDIGSYTQLWMDSFNEQTSNRRMDGVLAVGQHLRNGKFEVLEFLGAGGQASVYLVADTSERSESEIKSQSESQSESSSEPKSEPSSESSTESSSELNSNSNSDPSSAPSAEAGSNNQGTKQECKKVVLKEFILPSHAGAELSVRSLEHIEKELQLMKKLQHPNIVEYHDIFVEDHRCYLVLEHVEGKSLRTIVEESGPFSEEQLLALAEQMATILQTLHSQNPPVVHRDFTPENLLLSKDGTLKIIDFNVAQQLEEGATRSIVGKHSYLPPEQFRGKACPQSDIYAFGSTLYFLSTGEEAEPLTCSHPILKLESLSADFDSLVAKSTELELENRFANASTILTELKKLKGPEGTESTEEADTIN